MNYLLFDIGGTKTRVAISRDGVTFANPVIIDTSKDFEKAMENLEHVAKKMTQGEKLEFAAGDVSGILSRDKKILLNAPHLPGWNGKAIVDEISRRVEAPTFIENDAALVGLGEAIYGGGRGHEIVAYITVSTGVGGARIVDGKIDRAAIGFEPGHQIIDATHTIHQHSIGGRGLDLEGIISGTSISERYHKKPYEITEEAFWDDMARLLAYGLNNTIVHWSPDVVVIGGSMMNKVGIPVDRVRAHLKGILHIYSELPRIEHSTLGEVGGLFGALALIKSNIKV